MSSSSPKLLWKPNPARVQASCLDKFRKRLNARYGLNLETYEQIHSFSVTELEMFWEAVWDEVGLRYTRKYEKVLSDPAAKPIDLPRFFEGATLNYAENVLFPLHPANSTACMPSAPYHWPPAASLAILEVPEAGGLSSSPPEAQANRVTWGELRRRVAVLSEALRRKGVKAGDRIATVSANTSKPIVSFLAAACIGATFSALSTDMGVAGIYGRLAQIRPRLIFTDDAVIYNGKPVNVLDRVSQVAERLMKEGKIEDSQTFEVVVLPNERVKQRPSWTAASVKSVSLSEFLESAGVSSRADATPPALKFSALPFDHPLMICFSSGLTGEPKCIVHSAGGVLILQKKELLFQLDTKPGDLFLQITTTAWIMWSILLNMLTTGASIVTYDGSPLRPTPLHLLQVCAEHKVTGFGASPRFIGEVQKEVQKTRWINPIVRMDLSALRVFTSTGSPLSAGNSEFFYKVMPANVQLISISGGTDIAGTFVSSAPELPHYAGEIGAKTLGMAVEIWDPASGQDCEGTGTPGELVCTRPFPTQPLEFFGATREKYIESYYTRFEGKGVWAQGDFISRNMATRGLEIHGRSDGVLNPSGVRFGSAEIYGVVEQFPWVADSICVGQRRPHKDTDERVLLFIKLRDPSSTLTDAHRTEINTAIRLAHSPRHVPAYIFQVGDIPVTNNGKKTELACKAVVCGRKDFQPSSATANPQALDEFRAYADLEGMLLKSGYGTGNGNGNGRASKL